MPTAPRTRPDRRKTRWAKLTAEQRRAATAAATEAARVSNAARSLDALERHIQRVADSLPDLTPEQRQRLAAMLQPYAGDGAA